MKYLLNLFNCFVIKRERNQWIASILLLVISIEMIPTVRAEDQVLELMTQKTQAVQLLKTLYLRFNESVALSKRYPIVDIDLAVKYFEIEFINKLNEPFLSESEKGLISEARNFLQGIISLNDPNSLNKKMIGTDQDQLSLELPDNDEIKALAQNWIQSWNLSYEINRAKITDEKGIDLVSFLLSYYLTFATILVPFFYCNGFWNSSVSAETLPQCLVYGWSEFDLRSPSPTQNVIIYWLAITLFLIYFKILSSCIEKSSDLATYLICNRHQKSLNKLRATNLILIDQKSKKHGIPHLNLLILELINVRALARPAWNESDNCSICLDSFQPEVCNNELINNDVEVTPCGHKFHKECLESVEKAASNGYYPFMCPNCRKIFNLNYLPDYDILENDAF
ncbi:MAG: RING finger protein [Bdellovibrionia bacterium]